MKSKTDISDFYLGFTQKSTQRGISAFQQISEVLDMGETNSYPARNNTPIINAPVETL